MLNINNQKTIGLVFTILGAAFFIILMGDLLFKVVGGVASIALVNYGLQMQGLPSVSFYIINLFNFRGPN